MAKRFTDTDKWKKGLLRSLQGAYKLLWLYILDECDHAGIWVVETDVAEIRIGEKIDFEKALSFFKNHVQSFDGGKKWFIRDFIDFQYGLLNPGNRAHNSVIERLIKYNLFDENKGLISPLQGCKDKEKDKDMDKYKRKVFVPPTVQDVELYIKEKNYPIDPVKWWNHYDAKNWMIGKNKMKNWHSAIATWLPDGYGKKESKWV